MNTVIIKAYSILPSFSHFIFWYLFIDRTVFYCYKDICFFFHFASLIVVCFYLKIQFLLPILAHWR